MKKELKYLLQAKMLIKEFGMLAYRFQQSQRPGSLGHYDLGEVIVKSEAFLEATKDIKHPNPKCPFCGSPTEEDGCACLTCCVNGRSTGHNFALD